MKTIKEMIITKEGVTVEVAKYINNEIKLEDMSAHRRQLVNDLRYVDIFQVEYNIIKLQDNFNANGWKLLIDNELISIESEDEDNEFLESVDQFQVLSPKGEVIDIYTSDSMYITQPLNELIRYTGADDSGKIIIDLAQLEGEPIFAIEIRNNELTKTLEKIKGLINKNSEVILSNQLRSKDDELEK